MLSLKETTDCDFVISFLNGDGIIRLCAGEFPVTRKDMEESIRAYQGTFLIAYEDNKAWGFIAIGRQGDMHLCLKTIGSKTREFFRLAIEYARYKLGLKEVLGYFPSTHRGAERITRELGFKESAKLFDTPVPYTFKTLTLT